MKGSKTINLDGKEIELKLTLGVFEDVQDHLKENGIEGGIEEALSEMKYLRFMLSKMAEYAGNEIDSEEFKKLEFDEISKAVSLITESTEGLPEGKGKKGK